MNNTYHNLLMVAVIAIPLFILRLVHPTFKSRRMKFARYVQEVAEQRPKSPEQPRPYVPLERYTWKENLTVLIDCIALTSIGLLFYQAWVMWQTLL